MYCADCGARNADDSPFCVECGIRLAVSLGAEETQALPTAQAAPPPRTLRALLERAHELAEADDLDGAMDMCRRAVIMEPRSRTAHALLGLLYEKKGHTKFAIREYKVVLEIDPRSAAERAKLEMLLAQEKEETDSFRPLPLSSFWSRWRIAVIVGAAALAFGVVAIIVHFAGQPEGRSKFAEPIALGTVPAQPSPSFYPVPTNTGPATQRPPYPVHANALAMFAPPNWENPGRQPGQVGKDVALRPKPGAPPKVNVPEIVNPSPTRRPETPPGGEQPPTGTGPTGEFTPVEGAGPPPSPPTKPKPAGILEISVGGPTRTADNSMFAPVEPDKVPAPATASEDEKAGRAAQVQGLRLKAQGRHQEAIGQFRAAIDAYQREIANHGATEKLLRAVETCKHAIEYSESRLKGP